MITAGALVLVGLAAVTLAFAVVSSRRGGPSAFVALCWVPLLALVLGVALHERLGYAVLAVLAASAVGSVVLVVLGTLLVVGACRTGTGSIRLLVSATLVAAAPLVALLAIWAIRALTG